MVLKPEMSSFLFCFLFLFFQDTAQNTATHATRGAGPGRGSHLVLQEQDLCSLEQGSSFLILNSKTPFLEN